MKTKFLIIIPIVVVATIIISLEAIVIIGCLDENGNPGLFTCEIVIVDFIPQDLPLGKKIDLVVAQAEGDLDKAGHNYVRLAIDSDIFSHDEKLLVIEKYVKEKNTSTPFTENVITGKREFESEEPVTFTWKQFGIGNPCPDVAIQVQSKSSDKPFYEHELTRLCQVSDEDVPFLQTWTQDDFPDFPYCSEWGEYVIKAKNMFGQFGTYHGYFCEGASVGNDVINIEPEIGKTGKYSLKIDDGSVFDIQYSIKGANILSMDSIKEKNSVMINLDSPYAGSLTISMPRQLIDAKISEKIDDLFFVFVDGIEVPYTENAGKNTRTLTISFEQGTKIIEIFGATPL